jgi:hypothetical protein
MNKSTKAGIAVGILILIVAGWLTFSPYLTLSHMQAAAQANDAEALNGYIDYPAVRANLKSDMAAMATAETAKRGASPAQAAMVMAFIGPMIDTYVQPATMTGMLTGRAQKGPAPKARITGDDVKVTRDSLTSFTVTSADAKAGRGGGAQFEMHGLGWRMVRITLPSGS